MVDGPRLKDALDLLHLRPGIPFATPPRVPIENERSKFPIVLAAGKDQASDSELILFCGPLFLYLAESANRAFFAGSYADTETHRFSLASWAGRQFSGRRPEGEQLLLAAIAFVNQYANEICDRIFNWPPTQDVLMEQLALPKGPKGALTWCRALVFRVSRSQGEIRPDVGAWTVPKPRQGIPPERWSKVVYRVAWIIGSNNDGYSYAASGRGWQFRAGDARPEARPIETFKAVRAKYVCLVPYPAPGDT